MEQNQATNQTETTNVAEDLMDNLWENSQEESEFSEFFKTPSSKVENKSTTKVDEIMRKDDVIVEEKDDEDEDEDEDKEDVNKNVDDENKKENQQDNSKTDDEEKESGNSDVDKENETIEPLKVVLDVLHSEGIIENYDDIKEVNSENFVEIINNQIELNTEKKIDELMKGLDEDGKRYLKFIKDGGTTSEFLNTLSENSIPDVDINDENTHEDVIVYYKIQVEGLTEEEAKEEYEILKENNKSAKRAEVYYKKLKENETKEKEALLQKQEEVKQKEIKNRQQFVTDLKQTLESKKEILGVPLTKEDKTERLNSIMKTLPNEKVSNFMKKLNEAVKNPEKIILLDKILNNDFKFDWIKVKEKSKIANETKQKLASLKSGNKDLKNVNSTNRKKSLADYFND